MTNQIIIEDGQEMAFYNGNKVPVDNRKNLGKIYQEHYQTGIGAEIGVLFGTFTNQIQETWKGKVLCIDWWKEKEHMIRAMDTLNPLTTIMVKGTSMDVVDLIADNSLDWIYIDGDHSYKGVKEDMNGWFSKVRKGGIISGHDYINWPLMSKEEQNTHDYLKTNYVWRAVDEFCEERGYKFELFHDHVMLIDGELRHFPDLASWWFVK